MSCPLDAPQLLEFFHKNRLKLFTGKVHQWVLATTAPYDRIASGLTALMTKSFDGSPVDSYFGDAGSAVDGIRIKSITAEPPPVDSKDQRSDKLDPPTTLEPNRPIRYVTITFNYRGAEDNMAWPVYTDAGFFRQWRPETEMCPVGAQWMVKTASGDPAALPDVPPELGPLDKLAGGYGARGLGEGMQTALLYAKLGLGVYLAVQVLKMFHGSNRLSITVRQPKAR